KRRQGEKETRRKGDKEKRRQGEKETRRKGDKEKRRQGEDNLLLATRYSLLITHYSISHHRIQ
ncbi:MAG: hypothetical protein SWZ49_13935, partial [Cyanobacteriota bacterium]|nr:hypothetical protein [Cyanobacteriota bacterium]